MSQDFPNVEEDCEGPELLHTAPICSAEPSVLAAWVSEDALQHRSFGLEALPRFAAELTRMLERGQ